MGFDGLFFGRADYEDLQRRNTTKTMEMVWKASANLGNLKIINFTLNLILQIK
jgi:hypothetical protein